MSETPGSWKGWLAAGVIILILAGWLNEFLDLPHVVLGAPQTPANWRESITETVSLLLLGILCWRLLDIYELKWKRTADELKKLAVTDELTDVFNRREFLGLAEKEFLRAQRFEKKTQHRHLRP